MPSANLPVSGLPMPLASPASGRAAIAMAAVRNGRFDEPGEVTDLSGVRPPTDVMAITSLPRDGGINLKGKPETG
jgi:hypothetical protein